MEMNGMTEQAPAKINLTLDVLRKRTDGYHELRMVMQSVSLADTVTLTPLDTPEIQVKTNLSFLPNDGNNIAAKAAAAFFRHAEEKTQGLEIDILKRIPVCAGTAGGSSDGAAVLRALNRWFQTGFTAQELAKIGEEVGSDVPYCVLGGTALAEGRGEILTPLPPLPHCHLVLCKPGFPISTPELFRAIDGVKLHRHPDTEGMITALNAGDLQEIARRMFNVFEDVLPPARRRVIEEIKGTLVEQGALAACMSGTGPTVFGLFTSKAQAAQAAEVLRECYPDTFLAEPI
jgi:4-diphosphocytidyl-2-C-methyl-D-erythritol kinase